MHVPTQIAVLCGFAGFWSAEKPHDVQMFACVTNIFWSGKAKMPAKGLYQAGGEGTSNDLYERKSFNTPSGSFLSFNSQVPSCHTTHEAISRIFLCGSNHVFPLLPPGSKGFKTRIPKKQVYFHGALAQAAMRICQNDNTDMERQWEAFWEDFWGDMRDRGMRGELLAMGFKELCANSLYVHQTMRL